MDAHPLCTLYVWCRRRIPNGAMMHQLSLYTRPNRFDFTIIVPCTHLRKAQNR